MTDKVARGLKSIRVAVIGGILLLFATHSPARSEGRSDSSLVYRWSAVWLSRVDIERAAGNFPWNDEETRVSSNDRLALLGEIDLKESVSLFVKGATRFRLGGAYRDEGYILEQGHAGFDRSGGSVRGRIFTRERVYRTDQRLLKLLSDESPFVEGRGEGVAFEANAGSHVFLQYIESTLKDDDEIRNHGGLPTFHGGDILRVLRLEGSQESRWHAGFTCSQVRSVRYGDHVTVGTDLGVRVGNLEVCAELARTRGGGWDGLRGNSLFDLKPREMRLDSLSAIFSEHNAFAAELEGLKLGMGDLGVAGLIPGYRFAGNAFTNREGEIKPALNESYVTAWWKPAKYDALLSIDASSGVYREDDFGSLIANARMRYRGGFELKESILCRTGQRSAAAVSFIDDNAHSRIDVTARVDDLGADNELSYLARGTINLGSRVAARSALYLYRSRESLYNVELEFRPRGRFLFRLALGSFMPVQEGVTLGQAIDLESPSRERFILLFTRIWFDGEAVR